MYKTQKRHCKNAQKRSLVNLYILSVDSRLQCICLLQGRIGLEGTEMFAPWGITNKICWTDCSVDILALQIYFTIHHSGTCSQKLYIEDNPHLRPAITESDKGKFSSTILFCNSEMLRDQIQRAAKEVYAEKISQNKPFHFSHGRLFPAIIWAAVCSPFLY